MRGESILHHRDIIVVGASAGGVEALLALVKGLPQDLDASVFIVLHLSPSSPSALAKILGRAGSLPVTQPRDGEHFKKGHVYVACPDHHLLLERDHVRIVRGPKENRHRPSVDPLFRTAAIIYGPRVIGVILTGALDDGTSGMKAIKSRGGLAVIQDPEEAFYPSMPASVLQNVQVDHAVGMAEMPALLARLVNESVPDEKEYPVPVGVVLEAEIAEMSHSDSDILNKLGKVSSFTCPDCHGTLWEMEDDGLLRFRCRVGHAFTAENMLAQHDETLESMLWAAMRALEESASLSRRMAERTGRASPHLANRYRSQVQEKEGHIAVMRRLLLDTDKMSETINGA